VAPNSAVPWDLMSRRRPRRTTRAKRSDGAGACPRADFERFAFLPWHSIPLRIGLHERAAKSYSSWGVGSRIGPRTELSQFIHYFASEPAERRPPTNFSFLLKCARRKSQKYRGLRGQEEWRWHQLDVGHVRSSRFYRPDRASS
jgi:hypothetical protein